MTVVVVLIWFVCVAGDSWMVASTYVAVAELLEMEKEGEPATLMLLLRAATLTCPACVLLTVIVHWPAPSVPGAVHGGGSR